MTTPTSEELLELYTELNYPSAVKFRAGILRAGYKVRLADVQKFVDSQTPKQLFQKKPLHKGNVIASRANERWMLDLIDYTTMPDGAFKYVLMGIDVVHATYSPKQQMTKCQHRSSPSQNASLQRTANHMN